MKKALLLLTLSFTFFITSCEKDKEEEKDPKVTFTLMLTDGNNNVYQGETVGLSSNQEMIISLFRLYISQLTITNNSDAAIDLKDIVLVDPGVSNGDQSFTITTNSGDFKSIQFNLGLDAITNDSDPSTFDNSHPLSTYNSMYWSMLKYRFAKFEAKANVAGSLGGISDIAIAYHPGTDPLMQSVDLPLNFSLESDEEANINILINLDELFAGANPFDLMSGNEAQSHSGSSDIEVARKFMENLKSSITVVKE